MNNSFVLSLGGSMVSLSSGLNVIFLKKFKKIIEKRVKLGDRFVIVVGGGFLARDYIEQANKVNKKMELEDRDWIGIAATRMNANIVKSVFSDLAYPLLISDPRVKIKTDKPLLFSGGYLPGSSSDFVSAILTKTYKVNKLINISNIDYVYDKDPKKNSDAKKIEKIDWESFLKIVGDKWTPGLNSPFDPIASRFCKKENKKVIILNGEKLNNLNNCFSGKKFKGTEIYG